MAADFGEQVRANQKRLTSELKPRYDFVVCGAGSSGSVIARRLAENPDVSVLLLEAGGNDDVPEVTEASQWPLNIGSERDWNFASEPDPLLNGRSIPFAMGKVLGGGSSINVMIWARGHRSDWEHFAAESGEPAWGYESVLDLYRSIEDWHGIGEPDHRGTGGRIFVQPAPDVHSLALVTLDAARAVGIPTYQSPNGRLMEANRGGTRARSRSSHRRNGQLAAIQTGSRRTCCHARLTGAPGAWTYPKGRVNESI